jgi:ribosomal protein S18 acetylase RimI-like enzyme
MVTIRKLEEPDWPEVWKLMEPVFRAGETYALSLEIMEEQARTMWVEVPTGTYVAQAENAAVLGTYFIKPNQAGGGSHVCNCGYIVGENARGQGVASLMCAHSQREAVRLGFRAMQFNFVVSTNEGAIRLWQKHGFEIVGRLPGAFEHPRRGFVDAFVMFKHLGRKALEEDRQP